MNPHDSKTRIDWVDYAKGICIILVVFMHANGGVEKLLGAETWFNGFIEWAKPFRMPDFFLISGLFLASRIDQPWRRYFDAKVVHFAYFYFLWMTIQHVFKDLARGETDVSGLSHYASGLIQPFATLWFIYLLAVFFVFVKVTRNVPPIAVFAFGAWLEMLPIDTGSVLIDEFAGRFVYFYAGYWMARQVFAYADRVRGLDPAATLLGLALWAAFEAVMVTSGLAPLPVISLLLGLVGTAALISASVLIAEAGRFAWLRYCGANSIVIYLAFSLFMGTARVAVVKFFPGMEPSLIALLSTSAGVIGPLALHALTKGTHLDFLFNRPHWARVGSALRSKTAR
jgi:uncharacterized membrane protein YcfT